MSVKYMTGVKLIVAVGDRGPFLLQTDRVFFTPSGILALPRSDDGDMLKGADTGGSRTCGRDE